MLSIVYRDNDLIAVNKPPGLLVHPSKMAYDATEFALHQLRDQIGAWVFPTHRLDRKTSGTLLFALNKETQVLINKSFQNKEVKKKYIAIVRGYTEDSGVIDYALKNDKGKIQDAKTFYTTLAKTEIDLPHGKHATSRYSLVQLEPTTGRYHQLRKHMAHILHPIIGDRPHGCNKQNRLFKEKFKLKNMMLHANELIIQHPVTNKELVIKTRPFSEFERMLDVLSLNPKAAASQNN